MKEIGVRKYIKGDFTNLLYYYVLGSVLGDPRMNKQVSTVEFKLFNVRSASIAIICILQCGLYDEWECLDVEKVEFYRRNLSIYSCTT